MSLNVPSLDKFLHRKVETWQSDVKEYNNPTQINVTETSKPASPQVSCSLSVANPFALRNFKPLCVCAYFYFDVSLTPTHTLYYSFERDATVLASGSKEFTTSPNSIHKSVNIKTEPLEGTYNLKIYFWVDSGTISIIANGMVRVGLPAVTGEGEDLLEITSKRCIVMHNGLPMNVRPYEGSPPDVYFSFDFQGISPLLSHKPNYDDKQYIVYWGNVKIWLNHNTDDDKMLSIGSCTIIVE